MFVRFIVEFVERCLFEKRLLETVFLGGGIEVVTNPPVSEGIARMCDSHIKLYCLGLEYCMRFYSENGMR